MDRQIHTAEETQKRFAQLPEQVQDLLYSHKMFGILQEVANKNQLHIDQLGTLEMETGQVMLGFTEAKDYPDALMQSLQIDKVKADTIAKEIDEMLFSKIRDAMKQTSAAAIAPEKISNPPAMSASAVPEKSVVMPSAAKAPVPTVTTPAPSATPLTAINTPAPAVPTSPAAPAMPAVIKPAGLPVMPHVDAMLSAPTVSIAPKPADVTTPTPTDVKKSDAPAPAPTYRATDPYHEPID